MSRVTPQIGAGGLQIPGVDCLNLLAEEGLSREVTVGGEKELRESPCAAAAPALSSGGAGHSRTHCEC